MDEWPLLREYESLRRSLLRHERYCESLRQRLSELERSGRLTLPQYFGEFPPPQRTPSGKPRICHPLRAGIFLLETVSGERILAVHEAVAERYLTAVAAAAGEFLGDYCFFEESMAIALFELSNAFPELGSVLDLPALYAALCRTYPAYVAFHNDIYGAPLIPESENPPEPYLKI